MQSERRRELLRQGICPLVPNLLVCEASVMPHASAGRRTQVAHAVPLHCADEVDERRNVILVVGQWLRHRLAHRLQRMRERERKSARKEATKHSPTEPSCYNKRRGGGASTASRLRSRPFRERSDGRHARQGAARHEPSASTLTLRAAKWMTASNRFVAMTASRAAASRKSASTKAMRSGLEILRIAAIASLLREQEETLERAN